MPDRSRPAPQRSLARSSRAAYGRPPAAYGRPTAPPEAQPGDGPTEPGIARIDADANERLTLIEFTWVSRGRIQPVIFVERRLLD